MVISCIGYLLAEKYLPGQFLCSQIGTMYTKINECQKENDSQNKRTNNVREFTINKIKETDTGIRI